MGNMFACFQFMKISKSHNKQYLHENTIRQIIENTEYRIHNDNLKKKEKERKIIHLKDLKKLPEPNLTHRQVKAIMRNVPPSECSTLTEVSVRTFRNKSKFV